VENGRKNRENKVEPIAGTAKAIQLISYVVPNRLICFAKKFAGGLAEGHQQIYRMSNELNVVQLTFNPRLEGNVCKIWCCFITSISSKLHQTRYLSSWELLMKKKIRRTDLILR
jgi:hypothetical protein